MRVVQDEQAFHRCDLPRFGRKRTIYLSFSVSLVQFILRSTTRIDGFPATRIDPAQVLAFEKDGYGKAPGPGLLEATAGALCIRSIYLIMVLRQPRVSNETKRALYGEFSVVTRALGSPHRLAMLEYLAQGERSVDSLASGAGVTVANASQHLQQLRRAGVVASRRDGKYVLYRLADDSVLTLTAA